jgi:hypothetical protein
MGAAVREILDSFERGGTYYAGACERLAEAGEAADFEFISPN